MSQQSAIDSLSLINADYLLCESIAVKRLLAQLEDYEAQKVVATASSLVNRIRENEDSQTLVEAFLHEYQLNSDEGLVLMGIAEALLRIPDKPTQDLFLQEKLSSADWEQHLEHSDSFLINIASHALNFTGQFEQYCQHSTQQKQQLFNQLIQRLGTPLIREAIKQAMGQLACQFVIAETIEQAL
ncbi:MAG: bifunctional proline dehydrogenase/L-glutamate gamma-semialdehyde dehydrogenase, partial [Methylococcaceae bacterium]|nr:bifunctional proline dehydrogenase/L-glutamate gamma-semialdehyde dehydrogenase [Methylococcaceae bacterium]